MLSSLTVLYEDNHVIAVVKPAGVLAQKDKTGDESIMEEVRNYIKKKKNKKTPSNPSGQAGNVFLGLLHRLDRPVSGVMLFAKTSKGASRLSEQFRNHSIEKTYHALVSGKPTQKQGILKNKLGKDIKLKKGAEYDDGQEVELQYEVVNSNEKYSLLKINIDSGKFHQIRTQLSLAGLPIVGDVKYGGEKWANDKAIALCATEIIFQKATEDEKVTVKITPPTDWETYLST